MTEAPHLEPAPEKLLGDNDQCSPESPCAEPIAAIRLPAWLGVLITALALPILLWLPTLLAK